MGDSFPVRADHFIKPVVTEGESTTAGALGQKARLGQFWALVLRRGAGVHVPQGACASLRKLGSVMLPCLIVYE